MHSVSEDALSIPGTWRNLTAQLFSSSPHICRIPLELLNLWKTIPKITVFAYSHHETLGAVLFLRKGKISPFNHAKV